MNEFAEANMDVTRSFVEAHRLVTEVGGGSNHLHVPNVALWLHLPGTSISLIQADYIHVA